MGLFTDEYKKLLIIQYSDSPNALAQIELVIGKLEEVYNLAYSLEEAFDLGLAIGKQLDVLGKIALINRYVPGFGNLNDNDYRFIIKAKIIKNYAKGTMIDEDKLSIQNALDFLFVNSAYVYDNYDMSMSIWLGLAIDPIVIQYIKDLDLIPRPQGVDVKYVGLYDPRGTFGFYIHNTGFGDKFNGVDDLTYFAKKII